MRKVVRRLLKHLTRSRARVGWFLFGTCALVYLSVEIDVARQFALVLAGVAAGAVFLPELSSNLWTMQAREIRDTIPETRVRELRRELLAASIADRERNRFIWDSVVEPLLQSVDRPLAVQWNSSYDIHVYLNQPIIVGGDEMDTHRLVTTSRDERILPRGEGAHIWVSLARTNQALMSEYGKSGCLVRELVEFPGLPCEFWRDEVLRHCTVNMSVNGEPLPVETPTGENSDVIRWEAPVPLGAERSSSNGPVPVMVSVQYPLSANVSSFPIVFASYFCVGRTELSFTAYHPDASAVVLVEFEDFLSRKPGGQVSGEVLRQTPEPGNLCGFTFSTRRDAVLWPGSGMVFKWQVTSRQ